MVYKNCFISKKLEIDEEINQDKNSILFPNSDTSSKSNIAPK